LSTPKPVRRRLAAAERREVIVRAATELFAERGYHAAAMEEIARRAGVTPPVLYDHFSSKEDLYQQLLARHRRELLAIWREHLQGDGPFQARVESSLRAWAAYVREHTFAVRMLFRDTTGDPAAGTRYRAEQARVRADLTPLFGSFPAAAEFVNAAGTPAALEMAVELTRSALTGLAIWWYDHPEVTPDQVVTVAMNALWVGLGRLAGGETWRSEPGA
jgi:AcrR family transcriptional regulator